MHEQNCSHFIPEEICCANQPKATLPLTVQMQTRQVTRWKNLSDSCYFFSLCL